MKRQVPVAAGGVLGDYVPFNFCARSVMLYVIYRNGVEGYTGGQESVVHLCSTVGEVIRCGQSWAFTDRHAELAYARYFDDIAQLSCIDWRVMGRRYWHDDKETRQAEFLVHDSCPWGCIRFIGVHNASVEASVKSILSTAHHRPAVGVKHEWYYG